MALTPPATLEALLFAAGESLSKRRIVSLLQISDDLLSAAIVELKKDLKNRGLSLIETGDELELRSSPEASLIIETYRKSELSRDLGKAALEALAIILYQNGATRGEIDWIRGVNSTTAIRSLLLRGLIERDTDATDKRRLRYTPSIEAYAHLGVGGFEELPNAETIRTMLTQHTDAQELSVEVQDAVTANA